MIHVAHLTRTYGPLKAVDDVSFAIGPGEIVGLLGHNGAGKTTIMKMLTGFLEPTGGTIHVDQLEMATDRRAIQAQIGYLPENCPVYPEMTVAAYLEYQAALHGVDDDRMGPLLRQTLSRTALADKALQPIATLSRGYRQRVGVAQAIFHQAKLLILDEPTSSLDLKNQHGIMRFIRSVVRAHNLTALMTMHDLNLALHYADRFVLVRGAGSCVPAARM